MYFSRIPPLLLLGMITTMSGSSTRASLRELVNKWNFMVRLIISVDPPPHPPYGQFCL